MTARTKFGVGAILSVLEKDYLYGTGTLNIRLTEVEADPAHFHAMEWVFVTGVLIYSNGHVGEKRGATIRVSAIASALRAADWLPGS